ETLLGQLLVTTHDLAGAAKALDSADRAFPGFPAARAGRAQLLIAGGRYADAARILGDVVRRQPLPQYAVAWGDALSAAGQPAEAAHAYALVDVIARLFTANGVRLDLELALFDADHHRGPAAVARARRALQDRPSTAAHDVLAWNLFRVGRLPEAQRESDRALALGSRDPRERYHAAAIAAALGDRRTASAHLGIVLAENPRFDARLAPEVERLARVLGLADSRP